MGLDGVELVMAVEEEFQIAISDSEASDCTTVRKLVELVHSRLRQSSKDPCPSQHSFYLARQKLIDLLHVQRNEIKPDTNLEEIIPRENRKSLWKEVTTAMGEGEFFRGRLDRPKWMTYSSFPVFLLLPCAFLKFRYDFPFTLALISSLPVYVVLEWATRWLFSVEFPDGMSKVKDLIKLVKSLDSRTWSEEEVFAKIRTITAEQLGVDELMVTLDAKFVDDLGLC
ncbi:MAG: phosphopantetheine-binding protein [Geobacteraceae bacterium]|nr:phosphopantetheine-binding protein [Geobacteraceae bacterium]